MADALHKLIIGMSGTGKTVLAKLLAKRSIAANIPVLVLDPKWVPGRWPSGPPGRSPMLWGTRDADLFLRASRSNTHTLRIVDECGQTIGRDPRYNTLATDSREACNVSVFMMQHYGDVLPVVRGQCVELFLFYCLRENGEAMQRMFPHPQLSDCIALPVNKGMDSQFFWARGTEPLRRCRLTFATGRIEVVKEYPRPLMQLA